MAEGDPCPISVRGSSRHDVTVHNQRPNSIYQVEVVVRSAFGNVNVTFQHTQAVVPSLKKHQPFATMTAQPGSEGNNDEITTTVEFYDATQRASGNSFSGQKESVNLAYLININP
jgi:hypothetical protein